MTDNAKTLWCALAIALLWPSPGTAQTAQPIANVAGSGAARAASEDDKKQPPAPPSPDDYRVGSGDKLRVEVYKDAQLSQSVQVRPDGKITLPLIGDLVASGKTPLELRDIIGKQLKEYMTNPVVTVIVVEATAAVAYITGEVNHPGVVPLQGPLTVLQALALAGGLKDFADSKNIKVIRRNGTAVQTISFNYKDAIRGGPALYLRPGDTVIVPD